MNIHWESAILHWLHGMGMALWVGGSAYLAFFLVPYMRKNIPAGVRIKVITDVGRRFAFAVWVAFLVMAATGVQMAMQHFETMDNVWHSADGHIFVAKMVLVVIAVLLLQYHTTGLGEQIVKMAQALPPDAIEAPPELRALIRRSAALSALSFLLLVTATVLGEILAHG